MQLAYEGPAFATQAQHPSGQHSFLELDVAAACGDVSVEQRGSALASWLHQERLRAGALVLRHTGIEAEAGFEAFVRAVTPELVDYDYASTPRTRLQGQVYTSTEYPAHQSIPLHNEMSYCASWPSVVWFCCTQPAAEGGETPLVDSREVYRRLSPALRERFERCQVLYTRTYNTGLDLTWQKAFNTDSRATVEAYCRRAGMSAEWRADGVLKTRQVCPAVQRHPVTGDWVWFNQAHLFHISGLEESVRSLLLEVVDADDLPRNAYYGDGSAIEADALAEVRALFAELKFAFPWQRGDVIMVDNMLVAHGRAPFRGPRRVLVAMARDVSQEK
jgi:alpha-ketoglutarate-dependent taurine dioxygenase